MPTCGHGNRKEPMPIRRPDQAKVMGFSATPLPHQSKQHIMRQELVLRPFIPRQGQHEMCKARQWVSLVCTKWLGIGSLELQLGTILVVQAEAVRAHLRVLLPQLLVETHWATAKSGCGRKAWSVSGQFGRMQHGRGCCHRRTSTSSTQTAARSQRGKSSTGSGPTLREGAQSSARAATCGSLCEGSSPRGRQRRRTGSG
mmetsp:Transcript_15673/g.32233  ORF Transcript_15673/g.32233 Transcript_15673/m.32233 type:complete len:200 (-) Transcript_15673:285-884(-)